MENNDTSGIMRSVFMGDKIEKKGMEGLSEEEMNDIMSTIEDLFMSVDWGKVAEEEDEEEDTQQ